MALSQTCCSRSSPPFSWRQRAGCGAGLTLGSVSRARTWLWGTLHKRQIEEINELRKDIDALLSVLDHWVTPGAGDKQRQFEYMAEVLEARDKRGISGAYMRVASLIENQHY